MAFALNGLNLVRMVLSPYQNLSILPPGPNSIISDDKNTLLGFQKGAFYEPDQPRVRPRGSFLLSCPSYLRRRTTVTVVKNHVYARRQAPFTLSLPSVHSIILGPELTCPG